MPIQKMHMDQLFAVFKQGLKPGEVILDVREAEDYDEGHVPGSRGLPHDQVLAHVDELRKLEKIYIHCGGGGKASRVAAALEQAGLTNLVQICDSGMRHWVASGYPVQKK